MYNNNQEKPVKDREGSVRENGVKGSKRGERVKSKDTGRRMRYRGFKI